MAAEAKGVPCSSTNPAYGAGCGPSVQLVPELLLPVAQSVNFDGDEVLTAVNLGGLIFVSLVCSYYTIL